MKEELLVAMINAIHARVSWTIDKIGYISDDDYVEAYQLYTEMLDRLQAIRGDEQGYDDIKSWGW